MIRERTGIYEESCPDGAAFIISYIIYYESPGQYPKIILMLTI